MPFEPEPSNGWLIFGLVVVCAHFALAVAVLVAYLMGWIL